jgi:hypothetical protein
MCLAPKMNTASMHATTLNDKSMLCLAVAATEHRNQEMFQVHAPRSEERNNHGLSFFEGLHNFTPASVPACANVQGPHDSTSCDLTTSHPRQEIQPIRAFGFHDVLHVQTPSTARTAAPTLREPLWPLSLHQQVTGEVIYVQQPLHDNLSLPFLAPGCYRLDFPGTLPVLFSIPDNPLLALASGTSYNTLAPGMLSHPWAHIMP